MISVESDQATHTVFSMGTENRRWVFRLNASYFSNVLLALVSTYDEIIMDVKLVQRTYCPRALKPMWMYPLPSFWPRVPLGCYIVSVFFVYKYWRVAPGRQKSSSLLRTNLTSISFSVLPKSRILHLMETNLLLCEHGVSLMIQLWCR